MSAGQKAALLEERFALSLILQGRNAPALQTKCSSSERQRTLFKVGLPAALQPLPVSEMSILIDYSPVFD
jgi:hypothetical protein